MLDTLFICNSAKTEQTPHPFFFHQRFHSGINERKLMAMSDESYSIAFSAALIIDKQYNNNKPTYKKQLLNN